MKTRAPSSRFQGMTESITPMGKTLTSEAWAGPPSPAGRPRTQTGDHAGRNVSSPSYAMSSGRRFLDRVARQHCPSPLHRHDQNKTIATSKETIYHRTVASLLTVCLSL